ncbi:hypothetical protein BCR33DRAFT_714424 [Rhizoclosmatium globosum]|uniref:INSIG-domain-containing protein n=1 Tax=Rhizoclosmatium globosum TaxID=329046 RepID=A0A1Y2CNT8_9FUNG|nr:hypothetical protein BCR33DRAFT_714424 [Rhizoclosmatium globosum]|eukprot:ORY48700.1 hypothetical protein BCR33DRAFT_714424 [Rhizoclosmatium globosum]
MVSHVKEPSQSLPPRTRSPSSPSCPPSSSSSRKRKSPLNQKPLLHSTILFTLGFSLSLLIDNLHQSHGITSHNALNQSSAATSIPTTTHRPTPNGIPLRFSSHHHPNPPLLSVLKTAPWLPISFGVTGTLVGAVLYPWADSLIHFPLVTHHHAQTHNTPTPSTLLRLLGITLGTLYAIPKIQWPSADHANLAAAFLSMGVWWLFDTTASGLVVSSAVAVVGTCVAVWMCTWGGMFWVLSVLFMGSVLFGVVGRGLRGEAEGRRRNEVEE